MSGFALVALGALLPWAQLDTKSFYPMWGDGKRFWVGDQVDADVVDGLLMLLLGLGGVLLVWLERSNPGAEALYRVGWVADVVAIFALWIAELRFIVKIDGVGIGLGPIVILLGVLVALAPALVPYIFRRLLYSDDR